MIAEEDEDVTAERNTITEHMQREQVDHQTNTKVVAVKGLRKEFKTNEGAQKKELPCFKKKEGNNSRSSKVFNCCHWLQDPSSKFTNFLQAKSEKIKVAVRNLSMGVEEGEVFGLLGHNGAGKTTTMRIITAEEAPTCGKVRIDTHDINSNMSEGFELLGYCPQVCFM